MDSRNKIFIVATGIAVIILFGIMALGGIGGSPSAAAPSTGGSNSSKILFSGTRYAPYSYQVYPGPMSQQARAAMAGFNLTVNTSPNGTAATTVSFIGTSQSQVFDLKPGYRLYIVEASFADDSYHYDSSLGDDGFIPVDQDGYVAQ